MTDPSELRETLAAATKGPWICYADLPSTEPDWHIITSANKMRVLANVHIEPDNRMDTANARLIALAPTLAARVLADADRLAVAEELAEALDCAADEYEAINGRHTDDTGPHWSISARRLIAAYRGSEE